MMTKKIRDGLDVVTRRTQCRRSNDIHFAIEVDQKGLDEVTMIKSIKSLRHLLLL